MPGGHLSLSEEAAQHARALRMFPGEKAGLRDGMGRAALGTIARLTKRSLMVDIEEVWDIPRPPEVHMLVPVGDRDRMLLLAEKSTELVATSWRPVIWRRSKSVTGRGEGPTFSGRIRSRMISALSQSGGGWLPEIHPSASVSRAVAAAPAGTRIILDASAEQTMLSLTIDFPLAIALGPEGGLEDDERQEMTDGGFTPVRLGPTTLRFETAGIAGLAIARVLAEAHKTSDPEDP